MTQINVFIMFKGEDILRKREAENLSAEALAALIGVKKANIYKWEKGHIPQNPEDFIKVKNWLETGVVKKVEIVPQETYTMQSLANLTASNKTLAESNKILAESHSELVTLVKTTVRESRESPLVADSTFADLLVLIAEVGSGKKKWHSPQEGAAELHNRFLGKKAGVKAKGIQND